MTGTLERHNGTRDDTLADFTALVYADEALLQAEFDAIVAANFGETAAAGRRLRPRPGRVPAWPDRPRRPAARTVAPRRRRRSPTIPPDARQRAPPGSKPVDRISDTGKGR